MVAGLTAAAGRNRLSLHHRLLLLLRYACADSALS
jgi:hypothetical protein